MKKHLYPLKGTTNIFVSLEGEFPVTELNGKKWGHLQVFEIKDSRTNSGNPLQTVKVTPQLFLVDEFPDKIDLENPREVTLPSVYEY